MKKVTTLGKAYTGLFFKTKEGYAELVARMSESMKNKEYVTVTVQTGYLIILGKDWRKGFTPVTNQNKIRNHNCTDYIQTFANEEHKCFKAISNNYLFKDLLVENILEVLDNLVRLSEDGYDIFWETK